MSGGSHNYMHSRFPDALAELADEALEMGESLKRVGLPVCADRTRRLSEALRAARLEAVALANLWHGQEWLDSGDWGKGPVRAEAIKLGEPLPTCQHAITRRAYGYPGGDGPNSRVIGEFDDCDECGEALNFVPREAAKP